MQQQRQIKKQTRRKHRRFTDAQIARALIAAHGVILRASQILHMDRTALYRRLQNVPELKAIATEALERTIDLSETQLFKKIKAGNLTAIIFFLKCRAKHRGYVERQEIDQTITDLTPANPPDIIFEFVEAPSLNGDSRTIYKEPKLLPPEAESATR